MFQPIITKLAGVSFGSAQKNIKMFGSRDIMTYALIREPENKHDPNAIKVCLFDIFFLGYVPKHIAKNLAPLIDSGKTFLAIFVQRNESSYHEEVGMTVKIVETT
jgi:HIRAN domain